MNLINVERIGPIGHLIGGLEFERIRLVACISPELRAVEGSRQVLIEIFGREIAGPGINRILGVDIVLERQRFGRSCYRECISDRDRKRTQIGRTPDQHILLNAH